MPPTTSGSARRRDLLEALGTASVEDLKGEISKRKKVESATATEAQGNKWRQVQVTQGAPLFLCYRPDSASPEVPLMLLHESFMSFIKNLDCEAAVSDKDMDAAAELCSRLPGGFAMENRDMHKLVHGVLRRLLLLPGMIGRGNFYTDNGTSVEHDGYIEQSSILMEMRVNLDDKMFQGLEYYRMCFNVHYDDRSHGLLLLIAGPYISVLAAVKRDDGKILAEPLSDYVRCFGPGRRVVYSIARLLRAIRLFHESYRPAKRIDCKLPYVLRSLGAVQKVDDYQLYVLGAGVLIKLTESYSAAAHRAWAGSGVAPALLQDPEDVGGGWVMVTMEYLVGWKTAKETVEKYKDKEDVLEKLRKHIVDAVEQGHATGFVHGDLRLPNVMVKETAEDVAARLSFEVKVVDFDWAGPCGSARYNDIPNEALAWHDGARYGQLVRAEHDFWFVRSVTAMLNPMK